jgi:hypothetical protein
MTPSPEPPNTPRHGRLVRRLPILLIALVAIAGAVTLTGGVLTSAAAAHVHCRQQTPTLGTPVTGERS